MIIRAKRQWLRQPSLLNQPCRQQYRHFASTNFLRVQLAYDLYESPKAGQGAEVSKSPILFLHGLFGSKKNNRSMSKVLSRDLKRPVYALDLRNHGDSPHNPTHDYTSMSQDVEDFIRQHSLPKATLIGHSMGAKVAMTMALHKPELVESLISVDNAPVDAALKSDFGKYIRGMRKVEEAHIQRQSEADEILQAFENNLAIRQFLLTNLIRATDDSNNNRPYQKFRIPIKTLAAALDNMADFPYKNADEARYSGPTLFVRGTKSHYVADNTLPAIGNFFPRFELRDIESGHWVISENPAAFREAVVDFLSEAT